MSPASSTTSLKLPEDVKELVLAAARHKGVSPHAFMVEAIRAAATAEEKRASFVADAQEARERMLKSGKGFAADDVHAWLHAHARGKAAAKPKAKRWRS